MRRCVWSEKENDIEKRREGNTIGTRCGVNQIALTSVPVVRDQNTSDDIKFSSENGRRPVVSCRWANCPDLLSSAALNNSHPCPRLAVCELSAASQQPQQ